MINVPMGWRERERLCYKYLASLEVETRHGQDLFTDLNQVKKEEEHETFIFPCDDGCDSNRVEMHLCILLKV